jgi:hypothetical protein
MDSLRTISADRLVNSAQALIPYYPAPDAMQIDSILARLCKAFDVPFTVESDAKQIWRRRCRIAQPPEITHPEHADQGGRA